MRSLRRTLAIIILLSCLPAGAESIRSLYNKAVKAEARQDYEAAYEYYKAAYDKKPDDLKYRVPFERVRFLASASMVRRAQKLREQGNLQEALQTFLKAAAVDPSNDLALQEVRRTQQMIQKQQPPGDNKPAPPPEEDTLRRRLEQADSPVDLGPLSGVPLHALKVTAD